MAKGVYRILSPSGKSYVGMTNDSFENRWYGHLKDLRSGKHKNKGLLRAYTKYGESALLFEILEEFTDDTSGEVILLAEQAWWDRIKTESPGVYNGRPTGTGSVFHTAETRAKIANSMRLARPPSLKERVCLHCGEIFMVHRKDYRKYCGKECRNKSIFSKSLAARASRELLEELLIEEKKTRREVAKILDCSPQALGELLSSLSLKVPHDQTTRTLAKRVSKECLFCGKSFNVTEAAPNKFCSRACYYASRRKN